MSQTLAQEMVCEGLCNYMLYYQRKFKLNKNFYNNYLKRFGRIWDTTVLSKTISFLKLIFNFIEKTKLKVSCFKQPHPALPFEKGEGFCSNTVSFKHKPIYKNNFINMKSNVLDGCGF